MAAKSSKAAGGRVASGFAPGSLQKVGCISSARCRSEHRRVSEPERTGRRAYVGIEPAAGRVAFLATDVTREKAFSVARSDTQVNTLRRLHHSRRDFAIGIPRDPADLIVDVLEAKALLVVGR